MKTTYAIPAIASLIFVTFISVQPAFGQDAQQSVTDKVAAKKIAALLEQLTADSSSKRQSAREAIVAAGDAAIDPLALAAVSDNPQTAYSSVRLLGELARAKDKKVAGRAAKVLKTIADGKSPSARQARKTLQETTEPQLPDPPRGFAPMPPQTVSVSSSTINGRKQTTIKENDRTITINESPGKGIEMTVTDGDGKETKYKADDEKALEKASKEAAALYRKYTRQNPGGLFGQGFGGGRMGAPIAGALPPQFQMPLGGNGIQGGLFGGFRRRKQPGEKDPLKEMARLLKETKVLTNEVIDEKKRDARKLKQILDKLDHIETHLELLKRDQEF